MCLLFEHEQNNYYLRILTTLNKISRSLRSVNSHQDCINFSVFVRMVKGKGLPSPFNEGRLLAALLPVHSPKLRGWHTKCKANS